MGTEAVQLLLFRDKSALVAGTLVHPKNCPYQGMKWDGMVYINPMLPFGLRSATKIFSAMADALHWCLQQWGISYIWHNLDGFIVARPP